VAAHPGVLWAPLLSFLILSAVGVYGVLAGAAAHERQLMDATRSRAVDAATGFQIQLQQSFTPGVTFQLLVEQRPDWGYWLGAFNATAAQLLTRVPKGAIWNLQLQPFAQVMLIHPFRPEDWSQVGAGWGGTLYVPTVCRCHGSYEYPHCLSASAPLAPTLCPAALTHPAPPPPRAPHPGGAAARPPRG
jgi:hypothetical protein